jgi:coenzyme F420-0:L-glutamate ligase/coenzyme F420-1:gamma-L-glutamate ligase
MDPNSTDNKSFGNHQMELMMSRRSIRRYINESVPEVLIKKILTAAIWAPSAHNRQPWRFAVVTTAIVKHRLASEMGKRLREDLEDDQVNLALIEADVARSYKRITSAPVLVLVSMSMKDMDIYRDLQRQENETIMAIQSTAMAGQNLMLAAHALGIGTCWLCAPLFCPGVVKEVLDLPQDWQPQGLITMGFPAESKRKKRLSLDSRVLFISE